VQDDDAASVLKEIRDLQKEQLELIRSSVAAQQQAIANQAAAIARQQEHRRVIDRSRRWTLILLGAVLALFIVYVLQPLVVLWFGHAD
jgi:hypothetical protein